MAYTHITPGWEIEMSAHYYPDKKADRVAELIQLPREELTTMEEASVAQEKAIFSKFSEIEAEWRKQAAETIAIRKAREYLRALPVEHTSNQWKVNQFGWNVLSNMVYKMSYRVSENKTPDGTLINCTLSWDIHYNTLQHPTPDYTGDGWKIAGQSDKRFATKEELERYLQGRIKAYAHLFTEVSPPIPKGEERRFSVNGILSGGRPGPAGGAAVLRPSRHTTRGGADYGTEAAYHAPESAPKPGECSKAGDRPERAQETAPPENGPGTVTAALAPLSAPAWHFDSKMPLVRGSAPDTPAPPKVPSI